MEIQKTGENEYHPIAQSLEYYQKSSNGCCLSTLSYLFAASVENNPARDVAVRILDSLNFNSKGY